MNVCMPFDCNGDIDWLTYYIYTYIIDPIFKKPQRYQHGCWGVSSRICCVHQLLGENWSSVAKTTVASQAIGDISLKTHDCVSFSSHVICSVAIFKKICSIHSLRNFATSDHTVLSVKLYNVHTEQICNPCDYRIYVFNIKCIKWDQLIRKVLPRYTTPTDLFLSETDFISDVVYCSGGENCNKQHKQWSGLYEIITRALRSADEISFPRISHSTFTPSPCWKEQLEGKKVKILWHFFRWSI